MMITKHVAHLMKAAFNAPIIVIAVSATISHIYRFAGLSLPSFDWITELVQMGLAALAFAAAAQFRLSRLAKACPVSFWLSFGGAPLFLIICSLSAFILIPQLSLSAALLLGGILMLNGSAFDRRAIMHAPTPALVKAGVRLESAVILSLGLPIVVLLEGAASVTSLEPGALVPLVGASFSTLKGFALGGTLGLLAGLVGNLVSRSQLAFAIIAALLAYLLSTMIGGHPVIGAMAAGLIWGEQSRAKNVTRIKLRYHIEYGLIPLVYFGFGFLLVPRIWGADLLVLTFAFAAITIMRAGPRLVALQHSKLSKEGQVFLAWFGGTPGAASALFLLLLLDNGELYNQEMVLTVGTTCVLAGVIAARTTSQILTESYIRGMASAHKRRLFG